MYTDVSTKASLVQQKIDNWTKTWVQDNIGKYDIRDLDNFKSDLKKAWEKELKINSYGGGNKPPSTKQGYPSVSHSKRKNPLELEGFVRNADQPRVVKKTIGGGQLTDIFFDKVFYRNKIRTTPEFKNKISNYMDFITMDKRNMHDAKGRFMKAEAMDLYKKVLDKDVVYLLSKDSNLLGSQKNIVFTSFDKSFSDKYNAYIDKVNRANEAYKKNISIIEKTLGKKQGTIFNQMKKEGKALRKIFDVSNLPSELLYSMDHVHGISAAAQSGNKIYMQRAVDDMIGMTMGQNKALGYGGYSHNRNELMRKINAGESVKKNLAELNELAKSGYGDYFKGKGNAYEIKNKKVVPTKEFSFSTTREQRFGQYFKELYKTKKGKAEIIRQHGSYKNLIEKIGCPGLAAGGRVGFADGSRCFNKGLQVMQTKNITSNAQARNIVKLSKAPKPLLTKLLGPYGVGIDVVFEAGMIGTDVLKGKPLNEAVADNWIAGSVYKTFTGKTGEKLFNERLAKMDSSTKLYGDAMNLGSELEDLTKKLARMEADIGTARSRLTKEDIARTKAEIAKKTKEFNTLTKDGTLIEPGTSAYESYHSAATELRGKDRATSAYSKYFGPTVSRDDFESDRYQLREKVEPTLPGNYSTFKPELPTRGDVTTAFQDMGIVQPISGKVPDWYADELINQVKWEQLMEQPGIRGTQEKFFNTGGRVAFV